MLECSWCRYIQMSRRVRWDADRCMTQPYMGGATMSAQPEVQHAHAAEQYRHAARPYQQLPNIRPQGGVATLGPLTPLPDQ